MTRIPIYSASCKGLNKKHPGPSIHLEGMIWVLLCSVVVCADLPQQILIQVAAGYDHSHFAAWV